MCKMHWLKGYIHIYSELIIQWQLLLSHHLIGYRMKTNWDVPVWVILLERRISLLCCGLELIPGVLISLIAFKNLQQAAWFTFVTDVTKINSESWKWWEHVFCDVYVVDRLGMNIAIIDFLSLFMVLDIIEICLYFCSNDIILKLIFILVLSYPLLYSIDVASTLSYYVITTAL